MARILIILGLVTLAWRGQAQFNQAPDMQFYATFSPLTDSPDERAMWGLGSYYHIKKLVPDMPSSWSTNDLDILIARMPAEPTDGWIVEKEQDGSLALIAELTNPYDNTDTNNPLVEGWTYQQSVTLTTNQIHKMISGDLYAEVDFGTNSYLAELVPDITNGPTPVMVFPTPSQLEPFQGYTVISPDNRTAKFVFDGSHCIDPFYLPLRYQWTGYTNGANPAFTNTGVLATNVLKVGVYTVNLQVSDELASSWPYYFFYVDVITASQALAPLEGTLEHSGLSNARRNILLHLLTTAMVQFNQGRMAMGYSTLAAYINRVQLFRLDNATTLALTQTAQQVINAVKTPAK